MPTHSAASAGVWEYKDDEYHDPLTGGRLKDAFNWAKGLTSLQIHLLIDDSRILWVRPVTYTYIKLTRIFFDRLVSKSLIEI